ncbi:MAG: spore cortex biosynthesis protein YabQ [Roseburia sp.]|nr:spore cortex biosynthesis protein YabQ [Roseburia sp.]
MVSENEFLLHALIMGIFITFVYDILRVFRRVFPHNAFWVSLEDIIFWIYCAEEVFLLMYHESNGNLRWFAVIGALAGMLFYKKCISPLFVKYAAMLIGWLLLPMKQVIKWIVYPFKRLAAVIRRRLVRIKERAAFRKAKNKVIPKKRLTVLLKKLKMTL